jgi:hypothetical protein
VTNQYKLSAAAAAVAMAFASQADAQTPIYGAGASAVQKTVKNLVVGKYCQTGTATYFDNGTSAPASGPAGTIFRIDCTANAGVGFTAGVDIGYDTTGGSWKAFTAANPGLLPLAQDVTKNGNPVSTVSNQTASCGNIVNGYSASFISGGPTYTFTYAYNCPVLALQTTDTVTFGLTDVEGTLFDNAENEPLIVNTWLSGAPSGIFTSAGTPFSRGTELTGFPKPVFGVVFGVAASNALFTALQADQLTNNAGQFPSTCTVGAITAACAPSITTSQYRSIVGVTHGALNNSAAPLFIGTAPSDTSLELARRDRGSGTQGSSNAYFLNLACAAGTTAGNPGSEGLTVSGALPSSHNTSTVAALAFHNVVTYNATTTNVIQRLGLDTASTLGAYPTSGFVIGVVSDESEGKFTASAEFLKLDGLYPSNTAAAAGRYNYMSEENLHANANASGDGATLLSDLTNTTDTFSAFNYTGTGIVGTRATGYSGFLPGISSASQLCGGSRSK